MDVVRKANKHEWGITDKQRQVFLQLKNMETIPNYRGLSDFFGFRVSVMKQYLYALEAKNYLKIEYNDLGMIDLETKIEIKER